MRLGFGNLDEFRAWCRGLVFSSPGSDELGVSFCTDRIIF